MRKSESGSTHVIIVTVLAVALVAALGVLFWQNVINKPEDTDTKVVASASPVPTSTPSTKAYCAPLEKLCFDYPSSWKVTQEIVDADTDGMVERIVISDGDGQAWLRLETGLTSVGGTCGNNDNSYAKILNTHSTAVKGTYMTNEGTAEWYSDTAYAASWATYSGTSKNWTIDMELNNAKAVQSIGKLDPCDIGLGVINGKNAKAADMTRPGALVFKYYAGTDSDKTYASEAEAAAVLATGNATKAFAVLQSAHYE